MAPHAIAPHAEAAPAEPAPETEPDAGGQPWQQPSHPGAGRDSPPGDDQRGVTVPSAGDRGEQPGGLYPPTTEARAWPAGHEAGPEMPAGVRYRSALDPLLPASLRVPPRRDAPAAPVAVTAPGAPGAASAPGALAADVAGAAVSGPGVRPARRYRPAADDFATERVPAGLASAFFALHGADVSDVPVRRGRIVSRQATRLDAAAFSHGGVVYLPDSAGSLGQAQAQALLAHELTHAVQQRMLGAALPGEASAEGRELEEQAVATQRWFLGATSPVPALALLPSGTAASLTHAPAARPAPAGDAVATGASGGAGAAEAPGPAGERLVQRQPVEAAPAPTAASTGQATPDGTAPALPLPGESPAVAGAHPGLAELRDQLAQLAGQRPAALDDPTELDELAAKLYRRLRSRLRLELIVDRERAGLLTDFR